MAGFDWRYSSFVWLAVFVSWAAVSLFWSPDPRGGAIRLGEIGLFASLFTLARLVEFKTGLIASVTVAILSYGHFFGSDFSGFGNENFQSEFLVCLIPFLLKPRYLPFLGLVFVILLTNDSKTEYFCLWGGILLFLIWKRRFAWGLCWALAPLALLFQFQPEGLLTSINARIEFTFNTLLLWISAPAFGLGLGSFGYFYPLVQEGAYQMLGVPLSVLPGWFAGAAHNEYAQVLTELGVTGFGFLAWFIYCCTRGPWSQEKASLCILGIVSAIGFPWQTPSTLALAAVCLGREAGAMALSPPRYVVASLFVIGLLGCIWQYHALVAHRYFGYAYYLHKEATPEAFGWAILANKIYPWDWHIRYQLYLTLTKMVLENKVIFKGDSLKRVYEISASASPFSPDLLGARKMMEER